jgi:glycosyltransferase involved in cell wall biosynthesis
LSRIAFLSPLPPATTGIADYAADVLALLAPGHEIHAFHDQAEVDDSRLPDGIKARHASAFLAAQREKPYDVAVYQMGNGPHHGFLYDLMPRVPGLLVLHDLVLHHSRARMFLESPEALAYAREPSNARLRDRARPHLEGYRQELARSYPAQAERLAEAHLATVGTLLPYAYPLFRIPVESSRVTAVHNRFMAEAIQDEVPGAATARIAMPVERVPVDPVAVAALRGRLGIAPAELVVASFGLLSREKRVETVARAVARALPHCPTVRLMLVGPLPDREGLRALLARLGIAERTVVTGRVPLEELPAHIEAADLVAHLRYPTARETSAALLRVLAQGRPTVISDLENWDEIPGDAVVRADTCDEEGALTRAILRLAGRPDERRRLGQRAAAFARETLSRDVARRSYEAALAQALAAGDPPRPPA